jgi:hypothetical protein
MRSGIAARGCDGPPNVSRVEPCAGRRERPPRLERSYARDYTAFFAGIADGDLDHGGYGTATGPWHVVGAKPQRERLVLDNVRRQTLMHRGFRIKIDGETVTPPYGT